MSFSFTFPVSVSALDDQTITFADIADLENLLLITTDDDELSFDNGYLSDGSDNFASYTVEGNVVTLTSIVSGGPTLRGYTWAE